MAGGQEYSLNLGLDVLPISTDKDNLPDLNRIYNAVKTVARGLDDYTGAISVARDEWNTRAIGSLRLQNMCKVYAKTAVALIAGQHVAFTNIGSELSVIAASASNPTTFVRGFVLENFALDEYAEVYLQGLNYKCTGLIPGQVYFLTDVGTIVPVGTGGYTYNNPVGVALATNAIWIRPTLYI